jgi:hypothetical protein
VADKYLYQNNGTTTEKEAKVVSAGAGDAGKIVALDGAGKLDNTVLPVGIGADTNSVQASEALSAGDWVNIHDVGGAFRVRKADASSAGKYVDGFVLAAVASGAQATVYGEGTNNQVTGQTPGAVWLSASTPGAGTATPPSGSGQVQQRIGTAMAAAAVNFERFAPVVLA